MKNKNKGRNNGMFGVHRYGKMNPNYKGINADKFLCIDCNSVIICRANFYYGQRRCYSCAKKGKRNNSYKDGRCLKQKLCIDCNKKIINYKTYIFGQKRCLSCAKKEQFKNPQNHPSWQGGKSFEEYGQDFDSALKEQVRQRDKYKCQICGCSQVENSKQLDVHHIDYDKKNNIIKNLISLCVRCHRKTNHNRLYWKKYLLKLLQKIGLKS